MKKLISAVAVAALLGVAGTANAGFYCSVSNAECKVAAVGKVELPNCQARTGSNYANSKFLEWHWGLEFPDTTPFNYEQSDVVCFVDNYMYTNVVAQIQGFPKVPVLMNQKSVGLVYRGDDARFLIDNLRSIPYGTDNGPANAATPVQRTDFFRSFQP